MNRTDHNKNQQKQYVTAKPFSLRLSFEERAKLEDAANGVALGAYIKSVLFEQDLRKVQRRNVNPIKDHEALARVLGELGQSRLSSNLNQLARAVNMGALPVTSEVQDMLAGACSDVALMRNSLIQALELKPEEPLS